MNIKWNKVVMGDGNQLHLGNNKEYDYVIKQGANGWDSTKTNKKTGKSEYKTHATYEDALRWCK